MKKIKIKLSADELRRKLNLKDGHSPTNEEILKLIKPLIPKVKDGENPTDEELLKLIVPLIPKVEQIEKDIPILGTAIRDSLELLQNKERLKREAIDGLDNYPEIVRLAKEPKIVGGGSIARNFYQLFDVPQTYAGQASKLLQVKADETGLEFTSSPTVVDWDEIGGNQTDISLSGFTDDLNYWKTTTAQTGLTGDKTGTFNLTTTGSGTFGKVMFSPVGYTWQQGSLETDLNGVTSFMSTVDIDGDRATIFEYTPGINSTLELGIVLTDSIILGANTDLGSYNLTTTGTGTFNKILVGAKASTVVTPTTSFHLVGNATTDYAQIDTAINLKSVTRPSTTGFSASVLNIAGNVTAGQHWYVISYITPLGETEVNGSMIGPYTFNAANAQADVTIPVSTDYRVTGRKLYRSTAGSQYNLLLAYTISDNTTTLQRDNKADGSLTGTGAWFRTNTTNNMLLLDGSPAFFLGTQNMVVGKGSFAGILTATGNSNLVVGPGAGTAISSGSSNIFLGANTGTSVSTQSFNIFVGGATGYKQSGSYNVMMGTYNGYSTGSGSYNTLLGSHSGGNTSSSTFTGGYNTFLGAYSGNLASGSYGTFLGQQAGYNSTGSSNIFLGYSAGYRQTSNANILLIDNQQRADIATELTNSIIYGVMAATPASQSITFNVGTASFGAGNVTTTGTGTFGAIENTATQTTLTPTGGAGAGTVVLSQPEQGSSYKKVIVYFNAYTYGTNAQVYTFPTAFSKTPFVSASNVTVTATISTTTYTITAAVAQTGWVLLEGY